MKQAYAEKEVAKINGLVKDYQNALDIYHRSPIRNPEVIKSYFKYVTKLISDMEKYPVLEEKTNDLRKIMIK